MGIIIPPDSTYSTAVSDRLMSLSQQQHLQAHAHDKSIIPGDCPATQCSGARLGLGVLDF